MSSSVVIREPRSFEEYRAGLRVIDAAWQAAFGDIVTDAGMARMASLPDSPAAQRRFESFGAVAERIGLVAVRAGTVVGAGSAVWSPEHTKPFVDRGDAEIRTLYTHPDRWGEGIGTLLLEELDAGIPAQYDGIVLETFRDNEMGRGFYESRGFTLVDTAEFEFAGYSYPTVVYRRERRQ